MYSLSRLTITIILIILTCGSFGYFVAPSPLVALLGGFIIGVVGMGLAIPWIMED